MGQRTPERSIDEIAAREEPSGGFMATNACLEVAGNSQRPRQTRKPGIGQSQTVNHHAKDTHHELGAKMITTIAAGHYRVTASTRHEIDEGIHTALEAAQHYSMTGSRQGIVITRHAPDSYTVAVSQDVPYGLTVEAKELDLHPGSTRP